MAGDIEYLNVFIPSYFTKERRHGIEVALSDIPKAKNYYYNQEDKEALQGDGWKGFTVFNFKTGERKLSQGLVLTNSCDLASANKRVMPPLVTFAPLATLASFLEKLRQSGVTPDRIAQYQEDIRAQKIDSIFYLPPAGHEARPELIAILADAHSMPLSALQESGGERLFSLSDVGFWIFIFKLSVHFCRMHEGVTRG